MEELNYKDYGVTSISGRYITYDHIDEFLNSLPATFKTEVVGRSVRGEAIKSVVFGNGPKRILMWSQMHGNESTTTKAVLDLFNFMSQESMEAFKIWNACTIKIIPILNPDGARDFTRINANEIDLNRDAQNLSQPESKVLKKVYEDFTPDFCYNLHDQRTIFNVGTTHKPATVSFLAPAFDEDRNNSPSRKLSMQLIAAMNSKLQEEIPGQVGRYDDGFNANCVGDAFQMKGTPTILFEAGHYYNDYDRDVTRVYIFKALVKSLLTIRDNEITDYTVDQYLSIPENGKQFVDIGVYNKDYENNGLNSVEFTPIQYKEVLKNDKVEFVPMVHVFDKEPPEVFAHKSLNCNNENDVKWLRENDILKLLS